MKSIQDRLSAEVQDEKIKRLGDKVVELVKMSRTKMSDNYGKWDAHNDTYQGIRPLEKEDLDAREHGEPEKLVVPMTFAQVQTFVAYCFMLYTQRKKMFEFLATGREDYELNNDLESLIERDLRYNSFHKILFQLLLDTGRFGLGVVKHWWTTESQYAHVTAGGETTQADGFGFTSVATGRWEKFTKYQGNRVINISPYNFFPDTRFPLSEWKKGGFVADETEWHINQLYDWQSDGMAYGIQHIEPMPESEYSKRGPTRLGGFDKFTKQKSEDKHRNDQVVCVTECQMKIRPKDYDLGEEEFLVPYLVRIANDKRVISCEPSNYYHGEWTYDLMQFSPDIHQNIGDSLADIIDPMQSVVSYMINTRLASVRKSLKNNLVLDPTAINTSSLESRSQYITLNKNAGRMGIDSYIKQLNFTDTTQNHLNDADFMLRFMQLVTGVNENAMGQVHPGRRSATENRAANQGSASRMKVIATVGWTDCLEPMGHKMNMNLRQGLERKEYIKALGQGALERYDLFSPADKSILIGNQDHFVFDGTLASEKGFLAQSLQELLGAILSNPIVMQVLPLNVGALMEEILELRGVEDIDRFKLDGPPGLIPELHQQLPTGAGQGSPGGVPGQPG